MPRATFAPLTYISVYKLTSLGSYIYFHEFATYVFAKFGMINRVRRLILCLNEIKKIGKSVTSSVSFELNPENKTASLVDYK